MAEGVTKVRRRSIRDSDSDEDEERAKEIEDLKKQGILPADFPYKDGFMEKYDDTDLTKEVEELLDLGEITEDEAKEIKDKETLSKEVSLDCFLDPHLADHEQMMPPFTSDGIPISWTRGQREDKHFHLVTLKKGEPEFDIIFKEFDNVNIKIKGIERLQNSRFLKRFTDELEDVMNHRCATFNPNIRYLYHGTSVEKGRICEEGLDQRLSRMGYFGKGIYFSDTPLKCVHYSDDPARKNPEEAYILKCRVILGDAKVYAKGCYDTTLKREPEKSDHSVGWRYYDSVVGCPKDYNEFVVYENRRAMIEYIISIKINKKLMTALRNRSTCKTSQQKPQVDSGTKYSNSPNRPTDNHTVRIAEVRESVRRKRQEEAGKIYTPPTQKQAEEDDQMWSRLQKLHQSDLVNNGSTKERRDSHENMDRDLQTLRMAPRQQTVSKQPKKPVPAKSSSGALDMDVQKVLDLCIMEFLAVTDTQDSKLARYYVQKSKMDVNQAISFYYEDIS